MAKVRRIVTDFDKDGKSRVVSDGEPPRTSELPSIANFWMSELWAWDDIPTVPTHSDLTTTMTEVVPVAGQIRVKTWSLPPDSQVPRDIDPMEVGKEIAELWPGFEKTVDQHDPSIHITDTIDVNTVISGELTLHTDGGDVVTLGPGDSVVQTGTRHWWSNQGTELCVITTVMVGARRQQ